MVQRPKTSTKPRNTSSRCGLCGKSGDLTKTECCGNLVCDDQHKYNLFSYGRNSCDRNHSRYTLCAYHHNEDHTGSWKTCGSCREAFETEMYVWYATNEFNFQKLKNPPTYTQTLCAGCKARIRLGEDSYALKPSGEYLCARCSTISR
jgi:hypothetical protein